jgi:methyltransferase
MIRLLVLAVVVFGFMLVEARRAALNERAQRARGGIEPKHDVYPAMQVAYPGIFLAMIGEGLFRPEPSWIVLVAGIVVFILGKLLKWWAITTLGQYWTFRVIVVPGSAPVADGPYRLLNHPNYVGVFGELAGAGLIAASPVAGVLGTLMFTGLMAARVRVENRALNAILRRG